MKHYQRIVIIILITLSILLGASACSAVQPTRGSQSSVSAEPQHLLKTPVAVSRSNAPLNIAWTRPEKLNPLAKLDPNTAALMKLVFRSLFSIDHKNRLQYDLAEYCTWSNDHLRLTIGLRKDISFSNGQVINSHDVAASLRKLMTSAYGLKPSEQAKQTETDGKSVTQSNPSVFPFTLQIPFLAINHVETPSIDKLIIHLSSRADNLLWELIFPILPTDFVDSEDISAIPSSGPYRVHSIDNQQLVLQNRQDPSTYPNLQLRSYGDEASSLKAFTEEKLDLMYMPEARYSLQRNLLGQKSLSLQGQHYYSLKLGEFAGPVFSDSQYWRNLMSVLADSPDLVSRFLFGGEAAYLPLHRNDSLWQYIHKLGQSSLQALKRSNRDPITLAAPDNEYSQRIIRRIGEFFNELGFHVQYSMKTEAEYETYLSSGSYDLALIATDLSLPNEVTFSWQQMAQKDATLKRILASRMNEVIYCQGLIAESDLLNLDLQTADPDAMRKYSIAVSTLAADLPLIGLGFGESGIMISGRVQGDLSSPAYDAYQGVKDLWVWRNIS